LENIYARLAQIDDFPTPPLAEATAIIFLIPMDIIFCLIILE